MAISSEHFQSPHQDQQLLYAGADLKDAKAAMVMVHGRGASGHDILTLAPDLKQPDFAYVAPQAYGNSWYPYSFLAPMSQNEPELSSGLQAIADVLEQLKEAGLPAERVMLLGFSQGGCLTLEFAARNAQRFGGLVGLSAGLIGPEGTPRDYPGTMGGTPLFLGCDDQDFHIPQERVHETTAVFEKLGGDVTERLYSNLGHAINQDEVVFVQNMMRNLLDLHLKLNYNQPNKRRFTNG